MRMQGKRPGKEEAVRAPPLPCFSYQKPMRRRKNYALPRSSSIISPERQGDLSSATSTMGWCGIHTPLHFKWYCQRQRRGQRESDTLSPVSFCFERGQQVLPPPLSFLFEWGQHSLPLFLFVSFRTGAAHTAPISFHFKWGGVKPTRCCCFFHLPPPNNRGVSPCLPPNHGGFVFFASIILY
jgi:hypothetical protein